MVELLQEKAAGSLLEADALLDILGEEMSATDEAVNSRARGIGRGSLQQLMQRLRRINFANLVAMAARRCEGSRARLLGALPDLRAQEWSELMRSVWLDGICEYNLPDIWDLAP